MFLKPEQKFNIKFGGCLHKCQSVIKVLVDMTSLKPSLLNMYKHFPEIDRNVTGCA